MHDEDPDISVDRVSGKCERCGYVPPEKHDGLIDVCIECGKQLCVTCMEEGCCDSTPAVSGIEEREERMNI